MKIKEIPKSERPREKLIKKGANSLSSSELLLKEVRSMKNFVNLNYQELTKIKGIGPVKATKILAMVELGKRIYLESDEEKEKLTTAKDIYNYCKSFFYGLKQECFYCIYLDSKKKVLSSKLLFIEFTNYLIELGRIHGVLIYDHLIVSETKYYSFLENNLLD